MLHHVNRGFLRLHLLCATLDGTYLFLSGEGSEEAGGFYPVLESPSFRYTGQSTLSFWHKQTGDKESLLSVRVINKKYLSGDGDISITGLKGEWEDESITITTANLVEVPI